MPRPVRGVSSLPPRSLRGPCRGANARDPADASVRPYAFPRGSVRVNGWTDSSFWSRGFSIDNFAIDGVTTSTTAPWPFEDKSAISCCQPAWVSENLTVLRCERIGISCAAELQASRSIRVNETRPSAARWMIGPAIQSFRARLRGALRLLSPMQWIKNGVLVPLIFSGHFSDPGPSGMPCWQWPCSASPHRPLISSTTFSTSSSTDSISPRRGPSRWSWVHSWYRPRSSCFPRSSRSLPPSRPESGLQRNSQIHAGARTFTIAMCFVLRQYAEVVAEAVPVSSWMFVTYSAWPCFWRRSSGVRNCSSRWPRSAQAVFCGRGESVCRDVGRRGLTFL